MGAAAVAVAVAAAAAHPVERATISRTKATGTRQVLRPLPLATTCQPGFERQQSYSAFYRTEGTLDLCLPLASYERCSTILGPEARVI